MRKIVLALTVLAWISCAQAAPRNGGKLKHFPPEVRQTILDQLGDGRIEEAVKTSDDDGQVNYEVTIDQEGKSRDFTFAADGKLLEKEVFLEEIPAEVRKTITATATGIQPGSINESTDEKGLTNYDVEIVKAGVTRDFTVAADGTLASIQVFLAEVPAGVQKTIRETVDNGTLGDITKSTEDGDTSYDVEMTKDGKKREFSVNTDGELESIQVGLQETPDPVQNSILARLKDGKLDKIDKETDDDGGSVFVATMTQNGKTQEVRITPNGHFAPAQP
jgi:uncharacterized membrane protein YkoI